MKNVPENETGNGIFTADRARESRILEHANEDADLAKRVCGRTI